MAGDEITGFETALKVARMLEERYPIRSGARAVAASMRKELEARHRQMELELRERSRSAQPWVKVLN